MSTVASSSTSIKAPLPPGWVKCASKSHPGHSYYFHTTTRARTWERPVAEEIISSPGPQKAESKQVKTRKNHDSGVHSVCSGDFQPRERQERLPANDAASCVSMRSASIASEKVSHYFSTMLDRKAGPPSACTPSELPPSERGQKRKVEDDFLSDDLSMISGFTDFTFTTEKSKEDVTTARNWRPLQASPQNGVNHGQPGETTTAAAEAGTSSGSPAQAGSGSKTGKKSHTMEMLSSKGLKPLRSPKSAAASRPPPSPDRPQQQVMSNAPISPPPVQKDGNSNYAKTAPLGNGLDPLPDYDEVEGYSAPAPGKAKHKRMKASLPPYDLRNKITGEEVEFVKPKKNWRGRRPGPASYVRNKLMNQRQQDLREKLIDKSLPPPVGPPVYSNDGAAGSGPPNFAGNGHFARPAAPGQDGVFKAPFPVGRRQNRPYRRGQSWRGGHYNRPHQNYYTLGQMPVSLEITMANRTDENWTDSLTVCESPKFRSGDMDKVTCTLDQRDNRKVALQGEANAAVGSNTTEPHNTSFNAVPQDSLEDIVEMDVDMDVETEERLISEIQEVRGHLSTDASATRGTLTSMQVVQTEYMETETTGVPGVDGNLPLFIVLDTNVLLNHLKFLDDLKDQQISGMGRPVLVVPWVVMQELDALKSDSLLKKPGRTLKLETQHQAGQAVRYLYKCLQNRHPRVRGQTAQEGSVKLVGFNPECNDDRVLQCCLMYSQKFTSVNVILFTNDKNLCNKAVINGMQAFTRETLMPGIKAMYPEEDCTRPSVLELPTRADFPVRPTISAAAPAPLNPMAVRVKQEPPDDQIRSPCGSPPPPIRATTPPMPPPRRNPGTDKTSRRKQMADDVLCGLKTVLKGVLAVVLEAEMKAAYEENWKLIVYRKPPWSLQDLLVCFEKHWIAVFGMFLSRDVKEHLDSLVQHFTRGPSYGVDLQETLQLLQDALQLLRQLHNHNTYDGTLDKAISDLQTAHQQCREVLSGNMSCLTGSPVSPAAVSAPSPVPVHTPVQVHHTQQQDPTNFQPVDEAANMWKILEGVWKAVNYFSVMIFDTLDYKHSYPLVANAAGPLPPKHEAVQFLVMLSPLLRSVVADIDNFVALERADQLQPMAISLCNSILTFFHQLVFRNNATNSLHFATEVLTREAVCALTPDVLIRYGRDPQARERLHQGSQQLNTALRQLLHCASFILPEAQRNKWVQQQ